MTDASAVSIITTNQITALAGYFEHFQDDEGYRDLLIEGACSSNHIYLYRLMPTGYFTYCKLGLNCTMQVSNNPSDTFRLNWPATAVAASVNKCGQLRNADYRVVQDGQTYAEFKDIKVLVGRSE